MDWGLGIGKGKLAQYRVEGDVEDPQERNEGAVAEKD